MTSSAALAQITADCDRFWQEAGVPRRVRAQMRLELAQHLAEAVADGRSPEAVVGRDLRRFAADWAQAAGARIEAGTWDDVQSGAADFRRTSRRTAATYGLGMLALVAGVIVGSIVQGGNDVDNDQWRWVWTLLALGMGIGEIFTAGFFLLPFAIGAAAAAILAWLGVALLAQWLVFFGVSAIAFAYLRKFIDRQDNQVQPRIGANRWLEAKGVVLADIDPHSGYGMVRIDTEEWRAMSEDGSAIPAGTRIIVTDVQGSRLVVTPLGDE